MARQRCEDAPCCGHGGVCGREPGMSYAAYVDGFDERSDEELREAAMRAMMDEDGFPSYWDDEP